MQNHLIFVTRKLETWLGFCVWNVEKKREFRRLMSGVAGTFWRLHLKTLMSLNVAGCLQTGQDSPCSLFDAEFPEFVFTMLCKTILIPLKSTWLSSKGLYRQILQPILELKANEACADSLPYNRLLSGFIKFHGDFPVRFLMIPIL